MVYGRFIEWIIIVRTYSVSWSAIWQFPVYWNTYRCTCFVPLCGLPTKSHSKSSRSPIRIFRFHFSLRSFYSSNTQNQSALRRWPNQLYNGSMFASVRHMSDECVCLFGMNKRHQVAEHIRSHWNKSIQNSLDCAPDASDNIPSLLRCVHWVLTVGGTQYTQAHKMLSFLFHSSASLLASYCHNIYDCLINEDEFIFFAEIQ